MKYQYFLVLILYFTHSFAFAENEIRLWPNLKKAPGSENWMVKETVEITASGDRIIRNVVDPTLSVYLPEKDRATGAAIVIAPGGGFRILAIDNEGERMARWLNTKGIAAFVLKYRTLQISETPENKQPQIAINRTQELEIRNANVNPAPNNTELTTVLKMAIADAQQAMLLVRKNSDQWNIDPNRVGIMGFSAGGGVAVGTVLAEKSRASPDFIISVYGPSLMDVILPEHTPPLFIAVGSTHFNVTKGCLALFSAWKAAGKAAEIHIYDQVSGPFGTTKQNLPVDDWNERLLEWMLARKFTSR